MPLAKTPPVADNGGMSARRFKPLHAVLLVALISVGVVAAEYALEGGFTRSGYTRVAPAQDGSVRIRVADLGPSQVRFFRFLNPSNQEVKFFVGRDPAGEIQVAFDANEICFKTGRGYRHEGDWVVCNKCDKAFRLDEVNAGGGGCKPVPLAHRLAGDELVLTEAQILEGWRFFR